MAYSAFVTYGVAPLFVFLCLVAAAAALVSLVTGFAALVGGIGAVMVLTALGFGAVALAAGLAAAVLALARGAGSAEAPARPLR